MNTAADLAITGGKIFSVDLEGNKTGGTALAVRDGLIIAVGTDEKISAFIDPSSTRIIDAKGNTILPGLSEAHCHASWHSHVSIACDLYDIFPSEDDSREDVMNEFKRRLRHYIEDHPDESIIRGTGWNLGIFNGRGWNLPGRSDLDDLPTDKPVVLTSFCLHNLWTNTEAINRAGLTSDTKKPVNGDFTTEEDGFPAGIFFELSGKALIEKGIPGFDFSVDEYKKIILKYQEEIANKYGYTLVNDVCHTDNAREAYKELARSGELSMRVRGVYDPGSTDINNKIDGYVKRKKKSMDTVGDLFDIDTVKFFMEGEFAMLEPYEEQAIKNLELPEGHTGETFFTDEVAAEIFSKTLESDFQIHAHALGGKTVRQIAQAIKKAQEKYGGNKRNIIAHIMEVSEEDIRLIGELGLVCACQPRWMTFDTDVAEFYIPCFGEKKSLDFYPNKRLTDAGSIVTYGTDYPVTPPPNPYHEIQCGMTRSSFPDAADYEQCRDKILGPDEDPMQDIVSLEESISSLTINCAYQNHIEKLTGSLEVGKSAEIIILDRDIEEIDKSEIYKTQVMHTIFKGELIYSGK